MRRMAPMLLSLGVLCTALEAQEAGWSETRFHRIHLRNGNFIDGDLIQDTRSMVVLKMPSGDFGVSKNQIARDDQGQLRVEFIKMRTFREPPPIVKVKGSRDKKTPNDQDANSSGEAPVEEKPPEGAAATGLPGLLYQLKTVPGDKRQQLQGSPSWMLCTSFPLAN